MTRAARLVLGALAVATLCAAVVIQRVKDTPALVRRVTVTPVFSPNRDGYRDVAKIRFRLGRSDRITATVVDGRGAPVRRLATGRAVPADQRVRLQWDGRTDDGAPAAAGVYRVRLTLARRGRTLDLRQATRLSARRRHARPARAG